MAVKLTAKASVMQARSVHQACMTEALAVGEWLRVVAKLN